METINERFRKLREEIGLSQEEFAAKAHRTRSEIKNIEYGKTTPKDEVIASICSAYNIQEDWLRYGLEPMRVKRSREETLSEQAGQVLSGDPSFQKAVVQMILSRTDDELAVLEAALRQVYENLK